MLIDDVRKYNLTMNGYQLRDAIVFRIHEKGVDFDIDAEEMMTKRFNIKDGKNGPYNLMVSQLLPYDNIVIAFNDDFYWWVKVDHEEVDRALFFGYISSYDVFDDINNLGQVEKCIYIDIQKSDRKIFATGMYFIEENNCSPYFENSEIIDDSFIWGSYSLIKFLDILSCKNVKTEEEKPPEKLQKKRSKKGKLPLVSYHTLKLGPVGASSGSEGGGGWSTRIHFVRGHMREYTKEKPLFGRIVGRFWIAPHARGDKKQGMVVKDYEIMR